jgi:hypothetical protein
VDSGIASGVFALLGFALNQSFVLYGKHFEDGVSTRKIRREKLEELAQFIDQTNRISSDLRVLFVQLPSADADSEFGEACKKLEHYTSQILVFSQLYFPEIREISKAYYMAVEELQIPVDGTDDNEILGLLHEVNRISGELERLVIQNAYKCKTACKTFQVPGEKSVEKFPPQVVQ